MSYAALRLRPGLGDLDPWSTPSLHAMLPSDVFVLRTSWAALPLAAPEDALALVRAAGRGQNLHLDVRGIAVSQAPGAPPGSYDVDVVYTTPVPLLPLAGLVPGLTDNASDIASHMAADSGVQGRFPGARVTSSVFGQLTAPPDAIDHWRSQPVLWDHALGSGGSGGPTDTFAKPAEFSIVKGRADDGKRASPWTVASPPLGGGAGSSQVVTIAAVGVLALVLVVWLQGNLKEKRR